MNAFEEFKKRNTVKTQLKIDELSFKQGYIIACRIFQKLLIHSGLDKMYYKQTDISQLNEADKAQIFDAIII